MSKTRPIRKFSSGNPPVRATTEQEMRKENERAVHTAWRLPAGETRRRSS
ncbi:hypothetical protein AtDm6_2052 [Acetobacter tropicalis]|uniref:Uncharacterized protein n=1 Tax=Acetobacter tropicalis TaxID=104102 RepID=A0A094YNA1_9PROT|nr:hypothetical protein AtDm6_2052 [Acetobacter tropicalis]